MKGELLNNFQDFESKFKLDIQTYFPPDMLGVRACLVEKESGLACT